MGMEISKTQKVLVIYIFFVIIVGLFAIFVASSRASALIGLSLGVISSIVNFILLNLMMRLLVSENYFLTVQIYVIRLLTYIAAAFVSVRTGMDGAITFSAAIIAISLSVALIYGVGGMISDD